MSIACRVSKDEKQEIERRAKLKGITVSDYLRGLILNDVIPRTKITCPSLAKDGTCVKKTKNGIPIFKKTNLARCVACQRVPTPIDKATKEKYERKIERLSRESAKIMDGYQKENTNLKKINENLLNEKTNLLERLENMEITLKTTELKLKTTQEDLNKAKNDLETISSDRLFEENQKLKIDVAQYRETIRNLENRIDELRTLRNEALRQRLEVLTLAKDLLEDLRRNFPKFQYSQVDYVKLTNFKEQLDRTTRQFKDKLQFEISEGIKA